MHSCEVDPGKLPLRFGRSQLGALLLGIELDQNLPLLHRLARLKIDLLHYSRQIRTDGHTTHRHYAAYCLNRGRPALQPGHERSDRFRRRLKGRMGGDGSLYLPKLDQPEPREQYRRHGQHQNHPLSHSNPFKTLPITQPAFLEKIGRRG